MQTKIKIIIAAVVILILTVLVASLYISYNKKVQESVVVQEKSQPVKVEPVLKANAGSVVSVIGNALTIKTKNGDMVLNITDKIVVYLIDKGGPILKTKNDLTQGMEITFGYDEITKNVTAVNIIQK